MSSKRDAIIAQIVSQLGAAGKPTGLNVYRQRTFPVGPDVLPAQIVYAVDEEVATGPGSGAPGHIKRKARRTCKVAVYSRVDGGSSTDNALDPLLTWSVQQLCTDVTLASTAYDCKELGTVWDEADADQMYGGARQYFSVDYVTDAHDPTSNAGA